MLTDGCGANTKGRFSSGNRSAGRTRAARPVTMAARTSGNDGRDGIGNGAGGIVTAKVTAGL